MSLNPGARSSFQNSHVDGYRDPDTQAISHYLPKHISREFGRKWSNRGPNQYPGEMLVPKVVIYQLCLSTSPKEGHSYGE